MSKGNLDGGDLLIKCLLKEGVKYIFGIIGGELLRIYDAIYRWGREEGINTIMVRHEQAGGHAADAYARATGEIGVCMGTVGPGVTHLVPAVAVAWADCIPLLVIGAQVGRMFDDIGLIQGGLDQVSLMKPITKMQISVEEPDDIPLAVQKAIRTALSGRKGPVFLELRETALVRTATEEGIKKILDPQKYRPFRGSYGNEEDIKIAVNILKAAKKPLIVAGGGVIDSNASEELKKISDTYKIPVGTTINGIGSISSDYPTFLGSYLTVNRYQHAATEADVVLSLGCKWDYTLLFGASPVWSQDQRLIQVDIDSRDFGKNRPVDVSIIGDCKAIINQLIIEMEENLPKEKVTEWFEWNNYLQSFYEIDKKQIQSILESNKVPMKPQRLVIETYDFFPPDTLYVIDGGDIMLFSFMYMNHKPHPPRSLFYPTGMGHLGVGIPYAVGAKIAKPEKTVVCISGDGSFLFNVQELETAVRLDLPIICIVANNSSWGMIKSNQKRNYKKRYCDSDLPYTNYAKIAKSYGCHGETVKKPEDLKKAFQRAIDSGKPSVIDVDVAFEAPSALRFLGTFKQRKGLFGLR